MIDDFRRHCPRCGVPLHISMFRDAWSMRRAKYCSKSCADLPKFPSYVEVGGDSTWLVCVSGRALISRQDVRFVLGRFWHIGADGYVADGRGRRLHRELIGNGKPRTSLVDHINRNKLDNRRENLRLASKSLNNRNSDYRRAVVRGVRWTGRSWHAQIKYNSETRYLGSFKSRNDAVQARLHAEALLWTDL